MVPVSALRSCGTLISLGVEADWSFEQAVLAEVPNVKVICADGTTGPEVIRARFKRELWRAASRLRPYKFAEAWGLRRKPEEFNRFFSRNTFLNLMVSGSDQVGHTSIETLMNRADVAGPVLLKIDIEGSEYEVINSGGGLFDRCNVIAIEFHSLGSRWVDFENAMTRLMTSHYIAHLHGNNYDKYIPGTTVPQTLEVTLVHKQLYSFEPSISSRTYPIEGIDSPNKRRRGEILLSLD